MPLDEIQPRALEALTALYEIKPSWEGAVILSLGLDTRGSALAIAGNIAGAVTLAVDNDSAHLRGVVRSGACDFVVNTFDEAVRAMKNEVRKRAPLSVALAMDTDRAIAEVLDRGLVPQLFACSIDDPSSREPAAYAASQLSLLGADLLSNSTAPILPSEFDRWLHVGQLADTLAERNGWCLSTMTFDTPAALRAFDYRASGLLDPEDHLRRRWLDAAPRVLQRQHPPRRSLWLTSSEKKELGLKS
ncbi:MAG: hypothetical protein JST61_04290 [Acidobacteria bacterium]|nr:hypothetical protein [Acidobacteriota bacterium]